MLIVGELSFDLKSYIFSQDYAQFMHWSKSNTAFVHIRTQAQTVTKKDPPCHILIQQKYVPALLIMRGNTDVFKFFYTKKYLFDF